MISRLPAAQAEAVALRSIVGLDAASAAQVLGVRPGTLRRAARRGLQALSLRLEASAAMAPQEIDLRESTQPPAVRTLRVVAESIGGPGTGRIARTPSAGGSWATAQPPQPVARVTRRDGTHRDGTRRDGTPSQGIEVSR